MPTHIVALPFFDERHLPEPTKAYVAWIDVMGVRAMMARSLSVTANFVFKLHSATLSAPKGKCRTYPVMDGLYLVSTSRMEVIRFLEHVFATTASLFVSTAENRHRFIVRAALAFGPVVNGCDIPREASEELHQHTPYKDALLIGMPMIQALESETLAPPFGVFVHESARAFAPDGDFPFRYRWWPWFGKNHVPLAGELKTKLADYFMWCESRSLAIDYDVNRIKAHREMARQYLIDVTGES